MVDQLENFAATVLNSDVDGSTSTLPVDDASSMPDPNDESSGGSYRCVIHDSSFVNALDAGEQNREIVEVTDYDTSNDTLTVNRGMEDTTAVAHPASSNIYNARTAAYRDQIQSEFDSADVQKYFVKNGGDDSNSGGSWRNALETITEALDRIRQDRSSLPAGVPPPPVNIKVDSGERTIDNPLVVPPKVSIMGTDVRTTVLYPQNPKLDFIHADNLTFFWGLRFRDHKSPAFSCSFPRVIAEPEVNSGEVTNIDVLYSPDGYLEGTNSQVPEVVIDPPRSGDQAKADVTINNGKVTDITVTDSGSGYQTKPVVSVPAPENKQPFVVGSPYPLNCSTITGPFDENGKKIPPTVPLPYDTTGFTYDGETYAAVDPEGAGGGIIIDGRLCFGRNSMTSGGPRPQTPLNSFVSAQFTQVNQGGPGHLVINGGFAQFVSMFTTFSTYSFKCKTGGLALISNSVTDFGIEGLVAEGRQLDSYTSGDVVNTESSSIAAVSVDSTGSGYSNPTITIDPPATGTQAEAEAVVDSGEIVGVTVTDTGSGYRSTPSVTVTGNGSGANLSAEVNKVGTLTLDNLDEFSQPGGDTITRAPEINSIIEIGNKERVIESWEDIGNGEYTVSFRPGVFGADAGDTIQMYEMSNVNSGGHVFEYPGTGVTYNALPEYGGVTDLSQMTKDFGSGRVYHTSSDSFGNFYVGSQFEVDQQTGEVTLNTDQFNLSGLNSVGPFQVNGVTRGVKLREVSNRADLVSNSGLPGNTAPTISAIRSFFVNENRTVPSGGAEGEALIKQSGNDRDVDWKDVLTQNEFESNIEVDGQPISESDTLNFITN